MSMVRQVGCNVRGVVEDPVGAENFGDSGMGGIHAAQRTRYPPVSLSKIGRERAQSGDALLERWVAHAQLREAARRASLSDTEGSKLLGQGLMGCLQLFQRGNHVGTARELCTSAIRAK